MAKTKKISSWKWFAVKLLFASSISGEPTTEKLDEKYTNEFKLFEERIVVVKAQSSDHAYRLAELKAKASEMTYIGPAEKVNSCTFT